MGKPGSGILEGNFQWLGSFEQCKSATEDLTIDVPFNAQYCLAPVVRIRSTFSGFFVTDRDAEGYVFKPVCQYV